MIKVKQIDYVFDANLFADTIIKLSHEAKMTQREVAEIIGVETATIGNYEMPTKNCQPNMQNFIEVCNLFDINPSDFFSLSDRAQTERNTKNARLGS